MISLDIGNSSSSGISAIKANTKLGSDTWDRFASELQNLQTILFLELAEEKIHVRSYERECKQNVPKQ